jgi:hypothetical protein
MLESKSLAQKETHMIRRLISQPSLKATDRRYTRLLEIYTCSGGRNILAVVALRITDELLKYELKVGLPVEHPFHLRLLIALDHAGEYEGQKG